MERPGSISRRGSGFEAAILKGSGDDFYEGAG